MILTERDFGQEPKPPFKIYLDDGLMKKEDSLWERFKKVKRVTPPGEMALLARQTGKTAITTKMIAVQMWKDSIINGYSFAFIKLEDIK